MYFPEAISSFPLQVLAQKAGFLRPKRSFLWSLFWSKKTDLFSLWAFRYTLGYAIPNPQNLLFS
jgi:hypothetical protein